MNENLLNLQPYSLWKNFRQLTLIPRPSKHEQKVVEYLLDFGKKNCNQAFIDKAGNVVLKKNATPGMENRVAIVLQAHCDMVPQKLEDKIHNFETDPITTIINDGYVCADKTTLGADDGIGVAAIMSVLENNNIAHGPLEALITIDEETGMTGAFGLQPNVLQGDMLINLDSEEEGIFYVGCAGGISVKIERDICYEPIDNQFCAYNLKIAGYKGGHSGGDIHKNRPNAIKQMFRFLYNVDKIGVRLADFSGGNMHNAIPRESKATVFVPKSQIDTFKKMVDKYANIYLNEFGVSDPDAIFVAEPLTNQASNNKWLTKESQKNIIFIVQAITSGVFAMSADIQGLVETSNNLAIAKIEDGKFIAHTLLRSSVASQTDYLCEILQCQMEYCDAKISFSDQYPGWKPNPHSKIVELAKNIYNRLYNRQPIVTAIHAGLECGLISGIYPKMDMISFGPNIYGVHTPDERVEIASTQRFMDLLEEILKNAPLK